MMLKGEKLGTVDNRVNAVALATDLIERGCAYQVGSDYRAANAAMASAIIELIRYLPIGEKK